MCISKLMTPRIKGRGGLRANEAIFNEEQQVHHEGTTRESTTSMHEPLETMKERNDDSSASSSSCEGHLLPPPSTSTSTSTSPEAYTRSDIVVTSKQLIGRGAYADVFEVNHIRPRRCCGGGACDDDSSSRISSSRRRTGRQQQPQKNRYVIKQLRETLLLDPRDFQQAVSSMVMEAEFLSQLDHRNILRLRGVSTETAGNSPRRRTAAATSSETAAEDTTRGVSLLRGEDHFIVLDKLDETLSQRILRWKKGSIAKEMFDHGKQAKRNPKLHYAYQIALALDYMHKKNIIYRDLKPDNIGFKGDTVQLFDFGLCRELPRKDASSSDLFVMSGAGTRRYMCPECVLREAYNATCDTYSLSMVLHEILTLQKPYAGYRVSVHRDKVCVNGERPKLLRYWPKQLRRLLQESWEHDPRIRLTMGKVVSGLKPLLGTPVEMTMCAVERSFMAIHDMAGMFNLPQKQQQQKVHRNKMSATGEDDDDDARTESTVLVEVADSSS